MLLHYNAGAKNNNKTYENDCISSIILKFLSLFCQCLGHPDTWGFGVFWLELWHMPRKDGIHDTSPLETTWINNFRKYNQLLLCPQIMSMEFCTITSSEKNLMEQMQSWGRSRQEYSLRDSKYTLIFLSLLWYRKWMKYVFIIVQRWLRTEEQAISRGFGSKNRSKFIVHSGISVSSV